VSLFTPLIAVRSRLPAPGKTILWSVLGVMAAIILIGDLPLLNPHNSYRWYHVKVRFAIIPHLVGIIALVTGPLQFSTRLRRAYPKFHRILGRIYVSAVLTSAPFGALIPILGPKDPFFTVGVIVHASVWFVATLMAVLMARNRYIVQHQQWMVRSYALTFSFVITRILGPVWSHITITQYGMVDVIMSFSYVFVADVIFNWKELTTPRPGSRPAPARAEAKVLEPRAVPAP
jgi:uncharacterized membrane protein